MIKFDLSFEHQLALAFAVAFLLGMLAMLVEAPGLVALIAAGAAIAAGEFFAYD